MSQELHYTSVPRGLKPGSRGFGTVAATANLPDSLADRLEALSVYEAVFTPGDPSAARNPVAYVHVKLTVGGHVHDVLSRIGPAGLDYSGRPNKYAHHVILEPAERPDGGPAWLLSQPRFVHDAWEGEPRVLPNGTAVPRGDHPPGIAQAWRDLTGDAGWAGVLAESFLADMRRPVFLVFRPGMELLPLFVEAIALLPATRRWDVEFSTYLTTLPPGMSCTWRGVLEGSPQAKSARRLPNALIVDLCRPTPAAQGGGLVHLARTGERLDIPEAGTASAARGFDEFTRPVAVIAGPPQPPSAARALSADADNGSDWLPDLAVRQAGEGASLRGDRPRPRPRRLVPVVVALAFLVPLVAGAFVLSPALRQRLGFERAPSTTAAADRPAAAPERADPPAPVETITKPPAVAEVPAPVPEPSKDAERVAVAKVATPPPDATKPSSTVPKTPAEPIVLAFAPPDVPRSSLGSPARQERSIQLPEGTDDRIEVLNGPQFRLTAIPAPPHTWEVATRTGSGLGGGFALVRLNHADASRWQFDWTKDAKARSSPVEGFKDAILALRGRDGRPIYVLLRGVERESERPLMVWKDQRILFDKLDTRIRSVEWGGHPDVLDGSRWKPKIRRWKAVLSRSAADAADADSPRRVIEPEPAGDEKASRAELGLERDLVPGEVKLKLAINPDKPGTIDVRIEPDPDKVRVARDERSMRWEVLENATPRDKDGKERDPLEYRRDRLARLSGDGARAQDEMESLRKEIDELKRINEIRGTEDLLTRPARLELSVVIGLDVEGPGILDIVRIGEFAGGR